MISETPRESQLGPDTVEHLQELISISAEAKHALENYQSFTLATRCVARSLLSLHCAFRDIPPACYSIHTQSLNDISIP